MTSALTLYAGRKAKAQIAQNGLRAKDIRVVAGAAGGPKGLILLELDKFIFGEWLPTSHQPIDLVGASIGAWRMATACMDDPVAGFDRLARDYIAQDYEPEFNKRGKRLYPSTTRISTEFAKALHAFYDGHVDDVLTHPRYRLHVLTSRGRGLLRQTMMHKRFQAGTVLGFAAAFFANLVHRPAMGALMERVVFSNGLQLPFSDQDYRTVKRALRTDNFYAALQASCSIPFILNAVNDIAHAPAGSYWDGGLTDYHCHMDYRVNLSDSDLVLIPHFQQHLVPGWLDKTLKRRHKSTKFLDHVLVLAPSQSWIDQLQQNKIPDRSDFTTYADDYAKRATIWQDAVKKSQLLALSFADMVNQADPTQIPLLDL